jgi:hypothetical protein
MKHQTLNKARLVLFAAILIFLSCSKETIRTNNASGANQNPEPPYPPVPSFPHPCDNRPVIEAKIIPVGTLSEGRSGLMSATAGSKILFAGGMKTRAYSSRVDIYDTITHDWSTAELSIPERQGMAVATIGNKIFFAGGGDNDWGSTTSRVDIYDASNNTWSTAELSKPREFLTATTLGDKIFFAGGGNWEPYLKGSNVVDIYNNSTNTWSTATLSEGRMDHSATVVGNKIYFAGGTSGYLGFLYSVNVLSSIDVYDGTNNSWSVSNLQEPKAHMASIAAGNKIFWASGFHNSQFNSSNNVEIRDITTGNSQFACMTPKTLFNAVVKDDNIIFFTGNYSNDPYSGTHFEIYNVVTDTWSTGILSKRINYATIISVNNTIYVAGGSVNGDISDQVWKLEF